MNSRLLLPILLILAALLLAACGEPALQATVAHEAEAGHTQAEDNAAPTAGEPGAEASAAETPAEEAPAEEVPAEDTPAEETPVEAPPADGTPADDHAHEMEGMAATPAAEATPVPGDPAHGEALFTTMVAEVGFACATCHRVDSTEQLIGPGLLDVSVHGAMHVEGMEAYAYLHQSIVDPGAYVVPGFPDNLMPRTYSELFSAQDIQDLIAYLFTLTG